MNKILYVARKAKGFSMEQVAKALQMEEMAYRELEASLTNVTADIALRVSKLYDIDAKLFIYTEGREQSLIKFAMDEIANFKKSGILNDLPPQQLFHLVSLGNTALALQVELNHCLYRRYELERDNEAIRLLNTELKNKLQNEYLPMALKLRQAVHYITRSATFIHCQPRFPAARLKLRNRLALAHYNV